MKLTSHDYSLARFCDSFSGTLKILGDLETHYLRDRLAGITITEPVFVSGLARAGTTILANMLSNHSRAASHRYRDFPFLFTPYVWNIFVDHFAKEQEPVERSNKDRIRITRESPDAFEEPIWKYFFPHVHDETANHVLDKDTHAPDFEKFYQDHLRKILLIRGRDRYIAKANYNFSRIKYLLRIFPDARFVVPIRHPFEHVRSLVRQHALFCDYSRQDGRVGAYMRAVGNYQYGPQRCPVNLSDEDGQRVGAAWDAGDDYLGYAIQWRSVYEYLAALLRREEFSRSIKVVPFENLCENPVEELRGVFEFTNMEISTSDLAAWAATISAPVAGTADFSEELMKTIWDATGPIAEKFGFSPERK